MLKSLPAGKDARYHPVAGGGILQGEVELMADSVTEVVDAMMPAFVLAMALAMMRPVVEIIASPGHHSIPWEEKKPLIEKYGAWAVNLAEALCPEGDVECVRREAERLLRARRMG